MREKMQRGNGGVKREKIAARLLAYILIPTILLMAAGYIFVASSFRSAVSGLKSEALMNRSEVVANSVAGFFANYEGAVNQMVLDPQLVDFLKELMENNSPTVENVKALPTYSIAMRQLDAIKAADADTLDIAYVVGTQAYYLVYNGDNVESFPVILERQYYLDAKATGGVVMTDPYHSAVGNTLITTIAAPVYDGSTLMGLAALDFSIEDLNTILAQYDSAEEEFFILTSADGTIIYSAYDGDLGADVTNLYDSKVSDTLTNALKSGTEGYVEYTMPDGSKNCGAVVGVGDWGWHVITGMPEDVFMQEANSTGVRVLIIFAVLLLALVAVLLFAVNGTVVRPIQKLAAVAEEMAQGNMDVHINVKSNNEIGQLADALGHSIEQITGYSAYIEEISGAMSELADGKLDFELRHEYTGEFAVVKSAMINVRETLGRLIRQLEQSSSELNDNATQISNVSQIVAEGTQEQTGAIGELTSIAKTLSADVAENADNAVAANEKAGVVSGNVKESNQHMIELMNAMSEMNDASNQISAIIKTIEDIAFQTNILALNASVEAARAGLAGKGFAVVAGEVRTLAGHSSDAANNTSALIKKSIEAIQKGTAIAQRAAKASADAENSTGEIVAAIGNISAASTKQAEAIAEILVKIEQIAQVVSANSATAEESAAASEILMQQAEALKELLMGFEGI